MLNARARRIPWVLWLHDILPDGAAATGLVDDGPMLRAARALRAAGLSRGRPDRRPLAGLHAQPRGQGRAGRQDRADLRPRDPRAAGQRQRRQRQRQRHTATAPKLLSMGNIGFSQGLTRDRRARSRRSPAQSRRAAGHHRQRRGRARRRARRSARTASRCPGSCPSERLEHELHDATIALVTQKHGGEEFNIPSKIMNFMMYGLPVRRLRRPRLRGRAHRRAHPAAAGSSTTPTRPCSHTPCARSPPHPTRSRAGERPPREYAARHFNVDAFAAHFDDVLGQVVGP